MSKLNGLLYNKHRKFQTGGSAPIARTIVPPEGETVPKTISGYHEVAPPRDIVQNVVPSIDLIRLRQKNLKDRGMYTGEIDGIWGPKSEAAWQLHTGKTAERGSYRDPVEDAGS